MKRNMVVLTVCLMTSLLLAPLSTTWAQVRPLAEITTEFTIPNRAALLWVFCDYASSGQSADERTLEYQVFCSVPDIHSGKSIPSSAMPLDVPPAPTLLSPANGNILDTFGSFADYFIALG